MTDRIPETSLCLYGEFRMIIIGLKRVQKLRIIHMTLRIFRLFSYSLFAVIAIRGVCGIEFTVVDAEATGYGTFQSHNQKVVSNANGIFMTHIRSRNEAYTAQQWRLSRSVDGGKSFITIYEEINATNPPVLETDEENNLYLIRPDFQDGNSYLYRFLSSDNYAKPLISKIQNSAAGKYSMIYDAKRKRLFYFAHNNTFHVIRLDGEVESSIQLLKDGPDAVLQYPLLCLGSDDELHAAWTTQKRNVYMYWDIHHILSRDGGKSWRNLDGRELPPPIVADQHGPATRITQDDEFEFHTWLSSFIVKGGKVHFAYEAQMQKPREHYVRYDIKTGKEGRNVFPEFKGEKISVLGLDGFFTTADDKPETPLFFIGGSGGHLAVLQSGDNGDQWHDLALSSEGFTLYSIGGCRRLTREGWIIGSFTDMIGTPADAGKHSKVYFFKVATK